MSSNKTAGMRASLKRKDLRRRMQMSGAMKAVVRRKQKVRLKKRA